MTLSVDGYDVSQFQGLIRWPLAADKRFVAVRVADGLAPDDSFIVNWRAAAALKPRWLFVYHLLSNDPVDAQIALLRRQLDQTGVPWVDGMGVALDLEPTKWHDIATPAAADAYGRQAAFGYGRPFPLVYAGKYTYGPEFCAERGWPHWLPWPINIDGPVPADLDPHVHQWGTASAGDEPAFPDAPVDVNVCYHTDLLDQACNRNPQGADMPITEEEFARIQGFVNTAADNLSKVIVSQAQAVEALVQQVSDLQSQAEAREDALTAKLTPTVAGVALKDALTAVGKALEAGAATIT